eukprot:15443394-Alexandrium_andersonii.AAC.1
MRSATHMHAHQHMRSAPLTHRLIVALHMDGHEHMHGSSGNVFACMRAAGIFDHHVHADTCMCS